MSTRTNSKLAAVASLIVGFILPGITPAQPICPDSFNDPVSGISVALSFQMGTLDANGETVNYSICSRASPPGNNRVFYFSHGTVTNPSSILDELVVEGVPLPALFASQIGALAWVERNDPGLSVVSLAKEELRALRTLIEDGDDALAPGARSYLLGASQGANIVTLLLESDWNAYEGAGAVCGPIGSFWKQLQYAGDILALVDHYLGDPICERIEAASGSCECAEVNGRSGLLRPDPTYPPWLKVVQIPQAVVACVDEVGDQIRAIVENPGPEAQAVQDLLAVGRLDRHEVYQADPGLVSDETAATVEEAIRNHQDVVDTLGGPFYRNQFRVYRGSSDDADLNDNIQRFNPIALQAWVEVHENYETSGQLYKPLIAAHNGIRGQDPRVPFWHELLYKGKAILNGSGGLHTIIPLEGYGHCNITLDEARLAVGLLICQAEPGDPICLAQGE